MPPAKPRRSRTEPAFVRELLASSDALSRSLGRLRFASPVTHVYDPLRYAREPWVEYLRRYARPPKQALLLGMNPGPFGMAQTGVPFGEVSLVRDWLGIAGRVRRPRREHPKRPVLGFDCPRSEVSGQRLWGWAQRRFETPERFFERFFVWNYCPLLFVEESGRNRTPDKLPATEREPLLRACDRALLRAVALLRPRWVIGIGRFAEDRARQVLGKVDVEIGRMPHPSPASPAANRDWSGQADRALRSLGLLR